MIAALRQQGHLIDRLPRVRGRLRAEAAIARLTWFRVGGPAEVLFEPADLEDLATFLSAKPADVPVTVIGVGSNLLVRDGGIAGIVVHLGKPFAHIQIAGTDVHAGAGAADVAVAGAARDAGLTGLEFLSGVPGTIGGALRMNAGAYGREMQDITVQAEALDEKGRLHSLSLDALDFTYRHTAVPEGWIFTASVLAGTPADIATIAQRMAEIRGAREESQPLRTRTGGSTFQNPPDTRAWELIDRAGCRGLRRGGAQVSEKHCNFLINTGDATAADIEGLGEDVRRRVRETTGIELVWEIRRIGRPLAAAPSSSEGEDEP